MAPAALHVTGRVSATVGQTCVVTLEPLTNEIEEDVDLVFVPPPAATPAPGDSRSRLRSRETTKWNEPEPLIGGVVDLGALATEFLILGIDPYPRKPGAVFEAATGRKARPGPFAALASLTKGRRWRLIAVVSPAPNRYSRFAVSPPLVSRT